MDRIFSAWQTRSLLWLPEHGMGHYPVDPAAEPYDAAYFAKYRAYARTPMGRALTRARVALVASYTDSRLVDVGIGCGQFVEARPHTLGYDVNPVAVAWLRGCGLFFDPYRERIGSASFWDSLEHIPDPGALLANVDEYAFISVPIFTGADHALTSRHFRPDEHRWYWTRNGLAAWMAAQGFERLHWSAMESAIGREDIETFVFRRHAAPPRA